MHGDLDAWHRFSKVIFELMGYFEISILKQKLNLNYLNSRKKKQLKSCVWDILMSRRYPGFQDLSSMAALLGSESGSTC